MNTDIVAVAASGVLVKVALAALSLLGAYAVYYIHLGAAKLKEQTAQLKDEGGRKMLENALNDVERLAVLAVNYTEQTAARELRDKVKTGICNREKLLELGRKVFTEVKGEICPEAQQVITKNLGSFDHYLEQCIENAVLKVKQSDLFLTLPESVSVEGAAMGNAGKDSEE